MIAKSINCIEIDGKSLLFDDLEEECFAGMHLWIIFTVTIPGFILWVVGIPVYALYKLFTNIEALRKI